MAIFLHCLDFGLVRMILSTTSFQKLNEFYVFLLKLLSHLIKPS